MRDVARPVASRFQSQFSRVGLEPFQKSELSDINGVGLAVDHSRGPARHAAS